MDSRKGLLCLTAVVCAIAVAASSASAAPPNFRWFETLSTITTNKSVTLETATGSKLSLTTKFLGVTGTVTCETIAVKNGVIFNGTSKGGNGVGQMRGEVELSKCETSVCTKVHEPIKAPPVGAGEGTTVADANTKEGATQVYVDSLPRTNPETMVNEFMSITLEGGLCGAGKTFLVTTGLPRGGLGATKEGNGGWLGQVDTSVTAAGTEKTSHEIIYSCKNLQQLPVEAFDADAEKVNVDELEVASNAACMEGKAILKLVSLKNFALK